MGFHHVVLFRWIDQVSEEQVRTITRVLGELPASIPEIARFRCGTDAGLAPGNWHYAVAADFDDEAAYLVYRDHPAHRAVISEHIEPVLADRIAVQFPSGHASG